MAMTCKEQPAVLVHGESVPALLRYSAQWVRYLLAGLFAWAGTVKLLDPKAFARSIDAFGLVPEELLAVVAISLPVVELLVALAVALRWRFGLPLMAVLLLLFIGILWKGILSGLDVDCGCFSIAEQASHTSLWTAFWRDWVMLAAVAYVMVVDKLQRVETSRRDVALTH